MVVETPTSGAADGTRRFLSVCVATLALGVATTVTAAPYNPGHLDAPDRDRVAAICANVMRLSPGEEHFDGCMESLSDVEATLGQGQAIAEARGRCLDQGLSPGTPALAECELEGADGEAQVTRPAAKSPAEPRSPTSYFMASNGENFQREQLSCARLGVEPAATGFASCVASLESAMDSADNPAH